MAQQLLDLIAPGDTLPAGGLKINENFTELYNFVDDAPLTFAPLEHVHIIDDVTGLQDALDAKLTNNVSATARMLGRITAGAGVVEELTAAQVATFITYTAADVLAKLLTVDGAGSGLDADLLDGLSSAAFFQTANALLAVDGTAAAPAVSFASDPDIGLYRIGTNSFGVATAGTARWAWDSSGRYIFGSTSSIAVAAASNVLQMHSAGAVGFSIVRYVNNSSGPEAAFAKSRGAAVGSVAAVASGDQLGRFLWVGDDGTNLATIAAALTGQADATPSTGIVPGRVNISTANASGTLTEALRANSSQQCLFSDGTAAAPSVSYISDADTGMYRVSANVLGFSVAATDILHIVSTGCDVVVSDAQLKKTTDSGRFSVCGGSANNLSNGAYIRIEGIDYSGSGLGGSIELGTSSGKSVSLTGTSSTLKVQNGSAALPSYCFVNDTDCGLYRIGANQVGISAGATLVLDIATALFAITATTVRFNTTAATTVGAAGGASALPATPLGYITSNVNGTACKIPYYNT